MDYGPFQCYTISPPENPESKEFDNLVTKAVSIRLGEGAALCFDTELLRVSALWTGPWLDRSLTHLTTYKGELHARIAGDVEFQTVALPGWHVAESRWEDPRPGQAGSLPRAWGRYVGLFCHGDKVILEYEVAGRRIHEHPWFVGKDHQALFVRDVRIQPGDEPLEMLLANGLEPASGSAASPPHPATGWEMRVFQRADGAPCVAAWTMLDGASEPPASLRWNAAGQLSLKLPALAKERTMRVVLGRSAKGQVPDLGELTRQPVPDWETWTHGGPSRWPELPAMKGRVSTSREAYVVDTLPVPLDNPWHSWMRLVALDFFEDGRAAVATWNGDVWIVSGIDSELQSVRWRRFASGLFECLGLKIINGVVHVLERHQITRLHDLNGDGEADFYECLNNDAPIGPSYHAFSFGLDTDAAGNFYFSRCGHRVDPDLPLNGGVIRVHADGSTAEQWATGMRAPNGMSMSRDGRLTSSDNQGNWVPTSRVDLVQPGGFYGYIPHARRFPPPSAYDPPLCWIPYGLDNSSGGQVWVDSARWGPLRGHLLHLSYGKSSLFDLVMDESSSPPQGLVVPFHLRFDSGLMRARTHPLDGQVYACGLKGWQTTGVRDGGLFRVRYTGAPLLQVTGWQVQADAIVLRFDVPLDPASATDPENYAVEQWNYKWSERYGSPEYSVQDPDQQGRDALTVSDLTLEEGKQAVRIGLPGLQPVMQIRLRMRCSTADGRKVDQDVYGTIHQVPTP